MCVRVFSFQPLECIDNAGNNQDDVGKDLDDAGVEEYPANTDDSPPPEEAG